MSEFPPDFPGKAQYARGFGGSPSSPFQTTSAWALTSGNTSIFGRACRPGALVSQHRYPISQDDREEGELVPFETRLGLIVGVRGTSMDDPVDVVWSDWAPSREPEGLRAARQVKTAARARSAKE